MVGEQKNKKMASVVFHVFSCLLGFIMIYPLLWLVASSFKSNDTMFKNTYSLLPESWGIIKNYNSGFASTTGYSFGHFFMNSAIVTVIGVVCTIFSFLLAAYAVSRVKFFGANFWFGCIIMTMMIPAQVMVVPQYIILKKLHLNDTLLAMILPWAFGGADGPTAIFVTSRLAPELLGSIAVAAYSYMALVPVIQPPIMKALTTKKERTVVMKQLRTVTKTERIVFPIMVTIIVSLIVPDAAVLVGMLMLGNLMKESGVVDRLQKTAGNELMNIITIFLALSVGCTTSANTFLNTRTLFIIVLGLIAFSFGTAAGVLCGKVMYALTGGQVNPLIGSAGVSAVPMAARVSQKVGQSENPSNFLLMHAMGPNVAGVIGSAVAAGILINIFG